MNPPWLDAASTAIASKNGARLAACFFPQGGYGAALTPATIQAALPASDQTLIELLIGLSAAGQDPPFSTLVPLFSLASAVFQRPHAGWFVPVINKLAYSLVSAATKADKSSHDIHKKATNEAAQLIVRPFAIATATSADEQKRAAIHIFAGLLCRIYLDTASLNLARNVLKKSQSYPHDLSSHPKADQITYRYWAGRVLIAGQQVPLARDEFASAFQQCSNRFWANKRLLLIYLATCNIILGIFPSPTLLAYFQLDWVFGPLLKAIQDGDHAAWTQVLDAPENREWFRRKHLHILLKDKSVVVLWRNLVKRSFAITRSLQGPEQPRAIPNMSLEHILTAFQFSYKSTDMDIYDVEGICASLIDQGYIRGYILQSGRKIAFPREGVKFPPVAAVGER